MASLASACTDADSILLFDIISLETFANASHLHSMQTTLFRTRLSQASVAKRLSREPPAAVDENNSSACLP
jgi:hypothetical protein